MKIKEMIMGANRIQLLYLSGEQKETKTGKPFMMLNLTDGKEKIKALMWETTKEEMAPFEKRVLEFTITKEIYNDEISYKIAAFTKVADTDISKFIVKAPFDTEKMFEKIMKSVSGLQEDTAKLAVEILNKNKEKLLYWSAAKMVHHNCYGGLLYHMYRMTAMANAMAMMYPTAIKEYLVAGAALHDIGKLAELETDGLGEADYTVDGMLFGHAYLGMKIVEETAKELGTPKEVVRNITHIIASHHGKQEWGAITAPATLEAEIIHHIDMIDSRAYQYEEERKKTQPGEISDKVFGLGHRVYHAKKITKPADTPKAQDTTETK